MLITTQEKTLSQRIAADATVETILPLLTKPEEYVRVVLGNMHACQREYGGARVRIGITGEGKAPYHKVSFLAADGSERLYAAFDGSNPFRNVEVHSGTWSSRAMDLSEVREVLGRLRGFAGKKA